MGRRIRKHANPFSVRTEVGVLDRLAVFGREAPLEVEIGSGAGRFLLDRARANPTIDFVGLEVRAPLVDGLMARTDRPKNVVFLLANALPNLALAPHGIIRRFHIHFPDPCYKRRHRKRRVVNAGSVRTMVELLPTGGEIYAQTDLADLAHEMRDLFASETRLVSVFDGFFAPRPVDESTEWERYHEANNEPVFRMLFRRNET